MYYTIYKITNKLNGKYYIGMHKTSNLDDDYMGSGKYLKRSIQKHGIENFKKEILFIFDNEKEMKLKEKELVIVSEETYNLNEGGHGGFGFINSNSLNNINRSTESEQKRKKSISIYRKEKMKIQEEIEHMRNISPMGRIAIMKKYPKGVWKGRNHKPETIEKMKISSEGKQKGEKNSQYGTCWVTKNSEVKKIKKVDLDFWISKGYNKGRK
jgi:hypothetical protein